MIATRLGVLAVLCAGLPVHAGDLRLPVDIAAPAAEAPAARIAPAGSLDFALPLSVLPAAAEPTDPGAPLSAPETPDYLKTREDGSSIGIIRIESLFGRPVKVIDVSAYIDEMQSASAPDLKIVSANAIFAEKKAFLGFGQPNVFLAMPKDGHLYKFDAKSLKRAPSHVIPTGGKVQSGILVVFKNLKPEEIDLLLAKAKEHEGTSQLTCVNANCRVMADYGMKLSGKPLKKYYFGMPLLKAILTEDLTLNGKPLDFDLILTSPDYLEDFRIKVDKATLKTPCRHAGRACSKDGKEEGKNQPEPAKKEEPVRLPAKLGDHGSYTVRVSQPSGFGHILRLLWGAHMLFNIEQDQVSIEPYLPEKLKAFPQADPSLATRIKKNFLFSRPVIKWIRRHLARQNPGIDQFSDRQIFDMLQTHSDAHPGKYDIVIEGKSLSVMRLNVGSKIPDWILSKHVLISGYSSDVRFAGEIWKGEDGKIYLSNNSGTYRPSAEQLEQAVRYLQALFPNITFVARSQ